VVLEDHPRRMEREDRVDVLRVPRLVVPLDQLLQRGGGIGFAHRSSMSTSRGLSRWTSTPPASSSPPTATNEAARATELSSARSKRKIFPRVRPNSARPAYRRREERRATPRTTRVRPMRAHTAL